MRRALFPSLLALLGGLAAAPAPASAQAFSANYDITRPSLLVADRDLAAPVLPHARAWRRSGDGPGLSVDAGRHWFARVGVARGGEQDLLAVGGGYRWRDGESVSMQLLRGRQDRLGLAVRYDWPRYYLRLAYDPRWGDVSPDTLRFSAGVRF